MVGPLLLLAEGVWREGPYAFSLASRRMFVPSSL